MSINPKQSLQIKGQNAIISKRLIGEYVTELLCDLGVEKEHPKQNF